MDATRKWGIFYFFMFLGVVSLSYIPGVNDENGLMFGLFKLDLYDDALHFFSGLWAGIAALVSRNAVVTYFKLFGTLYFLDGVMGLFIGSGFLDFGVFINGVLDLDLQTRTFANLPHLLIGGLAIYIGFVLSKKTA